jgi:arginase
MIPSLMPQVDAHADINTPESTDTGNLHGCPVSFLLGLAGTNVEPFSKWIKPCLKPSELSALSFL